MIIDEGAEKLSTPTDTGHVVAECPLCRWQSAEVSLQDEVNAEWHARQEASKQFRHHFDLHHRPLPRFVRVEIVEVESHG